MSAHLPHLPLSGGRRVLIYQPSCQSCTSTVVESCAPTELDVISSDEEVASSTIAVASSSGRRDVGRSGGQDYLDLVGARLMNEVSGGGVRAWGRTVHGQHQEGGQHQEDHQQHERDRSRSRGRAVLRAISPGRLPILPMQENEEEGVGESGRVD